MSAVKKPSPDFRAFWDSLQRLHSRDAHAAEVIVQVVEFLADPSTSTGYDRRVLYRNVRSLEQSVVLPPERSLEALMRRRAAEVRS